MHLADECQQVSYIAKVHVKRRVSMPRKAEPAVGAACELVMQGVCIHKAECPFQSQSCHSHADHHQEAQNSPRAGGGALAACQNRQALHGGPGWQ